jgi:MFS family permease
MMFAALPLISRDFGLSPAAWTITIFLLVQAGTAAIGARLGDIYGRARILAVLLVLSVMGSLVSAMGETVAMVIIGRGLQGLSGAILPLCYGIARQIAPEKEVPFWIGTLTGGVTIASAFGYILGGHFADLDNWRLIFWFAAGYGITILPLLLVAVPRLPGNPTNDRIDWLGGALLPPGIAALLYGITTAPKVGLSDPLTLCALLGGPAILAWWWLHELRRPDPLIQVRLLARRPVLIANICFALAGLGMMQLPLLMMQYLQQPVASGAGLGISATMAGVLKLPSNIGSLAAAMLAGWLCGRMGGRRVVQFGGILGAISWGSLVFFHDNQWQVMVLAVGAAASSTTLLAAIPNLILENTPPDRTSEATGLSSVMLRLFSAAGSQLIAFALAASAAPALMGITAYPSEAGYVTMFIWVAISGILIALFARSATSTHRLEPAPKPA